MKKNLKRLFVSALLSAAMVTTTLSGNVYGAGDDISILVNNQPVVSEVKPVIIDGTTFVPLRPVAEAMGCEVIWLSGTKVANIRNLTTIISMQIGNDKISKVKRNAAQDTIVLDCPTPPRIINGSTYIPLRAMAESFGAKVAWDGNSKTVIIVYDTTVTYAANKSLVTFAGHGARKRYDSTLDKMEFLSPESMDVAADGSIYISDSGAIRKISGGSSETVEFEPEYISAAKVRCYGNEVYFTTDAFQDETGEKFYGIVKLGNSVAEGIYITEAVYSKMNDFDIDSKGNIYAIVYNAGVGKNYLARLNQSDMQFLTEIDEGFTCMTVDNQDNIYLGNSVKGSIYYYNTATGELGLFAGVDDNTRFVDGPDTMLFEPRSMYFFDSSLYVLDYNLVRRIQVNNGNKPMYSETLAGKISAEPKPQTKAGKASDAELAPSYLAEIIVKDGKVYLTDPVNCTVWAVE